MKLIKLTSILAVGGILFAGCVKERGNNFTRQGSPTPNTVDFPNQTEVQSLNIVTTPTIVSFFAELNSSTGSYPAATVTIAKNPTIVAGAGHEFLPDSTYTLLNTTATVDPVTHLAEFQLRINTTKIDLSHDYAVGYTITAVNGATIASNKTTDIITIGAKNKYDGVYDLSIKTVGWTAYGIADNVSAVYPGGTGIITAGINSVTIFNYLRGDNLQPAFAGTTNVPGTLGAPTAFGATTPKFTFDVNTNALTSVVNTTPDDGRGRFLMINPAITTSRYDPATKTIYAAYIMTQNGRPNQFIYDTLRYTGPRP